MFSAEGDKFKEKFKYFRRKKPAPDLSGVEDFDSASKNCKIFKVRGLLNVPDVVLSSKHESSVSRHCVTCDSLGLHSHYNWSVFSLDGKPGFLFIRNPFTVSGQQYWIKRSLEIYPLKPNRTNLDAHYGNLNDVWSQQWAEDEDMRAMLPKLRWTTLGYHHNWDTKVYSSDQRSAFPSCLLLLSTHIASLLGFPTFNPEAAIVNYYHMDSSLGAHVDYSEHDKKAPILSFSFGQTAIFLLGTQSKADTPVSLFLRSGDITVMSGMCRLSYHAIPLLLHEPVENRYSPAESDDSWLPFANYLSSSRININIRQVFST